MKVKPASQEQIQIYCRTGEALCAVQLLEDCLSHSIAIKKDLKLPGKVTKKEGDALLKNYRSYTLGKAIKLAKKENLFSSDIEASLDSLLVERNWFVHRSVYESLDKSPDGNSLEHCKISLPIRLKSLADHAQSLHHAIEEDLFAYSENLGMDMSRVREAKKRCNQ